MLENTDERQTALSTSDEHESVLAQGPRAEGDLLDVKLSAKPKLNDGTTLDRAPGRAPRSQR